jgi:hypothetical protein
LDLGSQGEHVGRIDVQAVALAIGRGREIDHCGGEEEWVK